MALERALVVGDDLRSFLSVVRSLGRRGIEVHACSQHTGAPAQNSRFIKEIHRLPPYGLSLTDWVSAVRALLDKYTFDLIIPCDDASIACFHQHAGDFRNHRLALPNVEAYTSFFDKVATRELAESCGVPIASGTTLKNGDTAKGLANRFGLPLAVKPRRSVLLEQPDTRQTVRIALDQFKLAYLLDRIAERERYFVEAFFFGEGVGISVLARHGTVLQAFQHLRVTEAGQTSGSSYRVSEPVNSRLLKDVETLVRASNLHGVAMFEFRWNRERRSHVLLEVNARFWGSLPLAVAAGVDFPSLLFDLLVHDRTHNAKDYRVGVYARNLTSDLYARLGLLSDRTIPLLRRLATTGSSAVLGVFRLSAGHEHLDSFSWDDPAPFRSELANIVRTASHAVVHRLPFAAALRQRAARRQLQGILIRCQGQKLRILFLCFGNICRSPFAAALLRARFADMPEDIEITSAGLLPKQGRSPPIDAIRQAKNFNIDLTPHTSQYAGDNLIANAHVIFVFDRANAAGLEARRLDHRHPVASLGDFAAGTGEIEDPYGRGESAFLQCYETIRDAIHEIEKAIRRSRGDTARR